MRGKLSALAWFVLISMPLVCMANDDEFNIPYEKFVLDNGLTVIVHEDHKAPIVAVNIWYHVGSKNEKVGKTGFAHLFEHLMFNGSEHYNDDYFKVLEPLGATTINGTTDFDRTNYFQNVPTSALDVVLWMESDRMGHLIGAIDQAKLDEQRGVVQNEKRQGENRPYGKVFSTIFENIFPKGHPYSWSVIGSMEDLDAASLEDVHEWFRSYYGPANAVIAIAGDISTEAARAKVEQYFGDIPSGPPVTKQEVWIAKRSGTHRLLMEDRVPQARVYMIWNIPQWGTQESEQLGLVADILASGKTSRLYKRLVYDEQIALNISALTLPLEISGIFGIVATVRPGVEMDRIETAINEEIGKFLADGPTEKELTRVRTQATARFIRGAETIGGFGGKSDILISNEVYGGSPDYYKTTMKYMNDATPADLKNVAKEWLSDGVFILNVKPFPKYSTSGSDVDRSKLPTPGMPPSAKFPAFQKTTLSNGLKIILAERHAVPVVQLRLMMDAGYASDQLATPGTANLAMNMLDEGTATRSALEISEELQMLGATLFTGSDLDTSGVTMSALKKNLDPSLALLADVVINPSFPESDFERLKRQTLASIQQEKANPNTMALRVLPRLLYGSGHAYSNPFTGSGMEAAVQAMTRNELEIFHQTWFKPNHSTLIVVGDTTLNEIKPLLEKHFSAWQSGTIPRKNIGNVGQKSRSEIYLLDRPGAQQSVIFCGHLMPPKANPDEIALGMMNSILGGTFNARINMNLREDKHWSYGARSVIVDARGQRPFIVIAPVQSDKTKEAMAEIQKELTGIIGDSPATDDELERVKKSLTLTLPGRWERAAAVASSIKEMVQFGYPDNYFETYVNKVRGTFLKEINEAAKKYLHPGNMVWVVVGDRSKIEAGIRELGLGEITPIDADGNVIQ